MKKLWTSKRVTARSEKPEAAKTQPQNASMVPPIVGNVIDVHNG